MKYKPNENLVLLLTKKYTYEIDFEMLDWYLYYELMKEDITIKSKTDNDEN